MTQTIDAIANERKCDQPTDVVVIPDYFEGLYVSDEEPVDFD